MVGFLQGVAVLIFVISFLVPISLISSPGYPAQNSLLALIIFISGVLAGISWLALARVIQLLEKINQKLSDRKNPE